MIVAILLLIIGNRFFGKQINGAAYWVYLGEISLNIRMLILLLVPLCGALLYSWRGQGYKAVGKAVFCQSRASQKTGERK